MSLVSFKSSVASLTLLAAAACTVNGNAPVAGSSGLGNVQASGGASAAGGSSQSGAGRAGGPGGSGSSSQEPVDWQTDCSKTDPDASPSVLRRLSVLEYQLSTQALLQLTAPPKAESIPSDTEHLGFRTYADLQTMSAENLRGYLTSASTLAAGLLKDEARRTKVFGCDIAATGCLKSAATKLGALAYRRPLSTSEVDAIAASAEANALDAADRFQFMVEALLTSPSFLYRVEVGDKKDGLSKLASHELAAKLSFALWGQGPSSELMTQAADGKLDSDQGLRAAAEAMLTDARTQTFFASFFRQWLGYQKLLPPDAASAARFDAMQVETDSVVGDFAWGKDSLLGILSANYTRATPELAQFYGLPAPDAQGKVLIPSDHFRAGTGILTHAALLSAKRDGDLIAMRGNWLRTTFLCQSLTIPADLAATIGEVLVGLDRVAIVTARNSRAECRACHKQIDPIGIAFAQFDRVGHYDAAADISVFGIPTALPGATDPDFSSLAELSAKLAAMPGVSQCLAQRAFLYVNGRDPVAPDSCAVRKTSADFDSSGQTFRSLLGGLVESPSFRLRRATAP